jgi:hypothetical protein
MTSAAFVRKTEKFSARSRFSDDQIVQIAQSGKVVIAEWVSSAAQEQGVIVRRRPTDTFAKAVSRLSDGVVDLDPVEESLVELDRAGVINGYQRGLLQVQYLR